jgi:hypothetical protein
MALKIVKDGGAAAELSGAVLFGLLWDELAGLLGTAATAALLRRAARRALPRNQELVELTIARLDDQFGYVVPESFALAKGPPAALRALAEELRPLLVELTGQVALRHLDRVPELRNWAPAAPPLQQ